jgi:acyl-CoA hydrolase/GNAT superfamily N-acetyltransferase
MSKKKKGQVFYMHKEIYWADNYAGNRYTARKALMSIKSGQRVFIGSSCGEPQHLVKTLGEMAPRFKDLEIVRLLSLETTPLTMMADQSCCRDFTVRSFYLGSGEPKEFKPNKRFLTPINFSAIPELFRSKQLPIDVALIQVSPPDDFGWMSLGISVDITLSAALSANLVIAQVNPQMPRVLGRSFIHVNDVDLIVEYEEPVLTIEEPEFRNASIRVGEVVAGLIEDGSTIHCSPGATSQAIYNALGDKNDLGIHTECLTSGIMQLVSKGIVTNKKKKNKEGRLVASYAIGSRLLYDAIDDNPSIDFQPVDYVCNPLIIARNNKMVSMNVVMNIDLTGQAAADALYYNNFSGVTGTLDFARGATMAPGGKSILMLTSTGRDGTRSRIIPKLDDTAVVVPRGDVHYVVTEYGSVNLFGKSLKERAVALISIAHPKFRDELFSYAKEYGLLGAEHVMTPQSFRGIYPIELEETLMIDREEVIIRPAKQVDERRIQEHFYALDKPDVVARFFHEKANFIRDDVQFTFNIDYVNSLTFVAVVGDFGFKKVIAVGEYIRNTDTNLAEVAFTVNRQWQGKGLSKIMLRKLADAARKNEIDGLVAYVLPNNKPMINLFNTLPYEIQSTYSYDDDLFILTCRFDQPQKTATASKQQEQVR